MSLSADNMDVEEEGPQSRDSTGRPIPRIAPHSWRLTTKNAKIIKDVQSSKGERMLHSVDALCAHPSSIQSDRARVDVIPLHPLHNAALIITSLTIFFTSQMLTSSSATLTS